MENRMTDNEIIKALECCIKAETWGDCMIMGCPASTEQGCSFYLRTDDDYENTIYIEILKDVLSLINRQKAEIESQREYLNVTKIRAEAIKDFAERLKETKFKHGNDFIVYADNIDNIAKEMVGE